MISRADSFEWDTYNSGKNLERHNVSDQECEEIFFDPHKKVAADVLHARHENRHIILGKTRSGRLLYAVFTIRSGKIRVISARDINKKEKHFYYGAQ